ncbi:hypothetical protein CDO44_16185 [Pigmentiphaga sp. NML080357]|uniref:hypothetical protein n=1 Tax=Pigmentiphaga sp. NML080357 TaxID=2008675 RepID=UPI000B417672|nr:hypothetical protein [Pigmentiphaga sp. NML080357]OVZ57918.1 hypothetical protein CDO44_16185 [Pigmentiphaga sp. NML080357]
MNRKSFVSLAALLAAHLFAGAASAADAAPASSCIEVEVNGQRSPSYGCLTQKLQPTPAPRNLEGTPELASEAIVQRSSNQLGLFNRAATANRMGNTFGTSVYPQRPPAPQYGSPVFGPR